MFGEDPFAGLFTPSPVKSSLTNAIGSPFYDLGTRSPLSLPTCLDGGRVDQLSFADILANYEEMEQAIAPPAEKVPPRKTGKEKQTPAVFRPFVSLESIELTVHRLAAMHSS